VAKRRSGSKGVPKTKGETQLDKIDAQISETGASQRPYGEPVEKLQKAFLGKAVATRLAQGPSTLLSGPDASRVQSILPFLYFYPSLSIVLCPYCPETRNPGTLAPLFDRGLATVFMKGEFAKTPKSFQSFAEHYQDFFIGPRAYGDYRYFSLNVPPEESTHENHYCRQCITETLHPVLPLLKSIRGKERDSLERAHVAIESIPHPIAQSFADRFAEVVKSPRPDAIAELSSATSFAEYLTSAAALRATPQLGSDFLANTTALVNDLRIDHPEGLDTETYLDIVSKFRGVLSPTRIPFNSDQAVSIALRINGEVAGISASRRAVFATFLSWLLPGMGSVAGKAVSGGGYGWEGARLVGHAVTTTSWGRKVWADFLSKCYYRVSPDAIHVWNIRRDIAAARGKMRG